MSLMQTDDSVTGPINLGNPVEFTILQLAELVIELTGSTSSIDRLPLPADDPRQRQPDIRRARELLHWEPKIALRDGLVKTIAFFDDLMRRGLAE
jgi:UDP-glucuronate decarboxylase